MLVLPLLLHTQEWDVDRVVEWAEAVEEDSSNRQ